MMGCSGWLCGVREGRGEGEGGGMWVGARDYNP